MCYCPLTSSRHRERQHRGGREALEALPEAIPKGEPHLLAGSPAHVGPADPRGPTRLSLQGAIFLFFAGRIEAIKGNIDVVSRGRPGQGWRPVGSPGQ